MTIVLKTTDEKLVRLKIRNVDWSAAASPTDDAPVRQGLQNGRHEDSGDCLVEYRVTDADEVDDDRRPEDRNDVLRHALPEMHQEALDLQHKKNLLKIECRIVDMFRCFQKFYPSMVSVQLFIYKSLFTTRVDTQKKQQII